jgi:hypothetical protein
MSRFAVLLVLGLSACSLLDFGEPVGTTSGEMQGWRFASGKPPTRAEYTAVVAACQDGAVKRARAQPLDACLADLGLKRAP